MNLKRDATSKDDNSLKEENVPRTMSGFLIFIFKLIIKKKKYWLLPLWAFLFAIAIALFLTGNGALLPAIYMAF